jgi:hypothetical protein
MPHNVLHKGQRNKQINAVNICHNPLIDYLQAILPTSNAHPTIHLWHTSITVRSTYDMDDVSAYLISVVFVWFNGSSFQLYYGNEIARTVWQHNSDPICVTPNYEYIDHPRRVLGSKSVAKNKREEKWWAVSAPDIRSWKLSRESHRTVLNTCIRTPTHARYEE